MKKRIMSIFLCICLAFATVLPTGCGMNMSERAEKDNTEDKLKIVTTAFPPYDFARQLAGEHAEVQMLLKPGSEAHNYEPTPQDMIAIEQCDVFLYIGGEGEDWVDQVLSGVDNQDMQVLALMDCVEGLEEEIVEGMYVREGSEHDHVHAQEEADHAHGELDEHIWTSPVNVMDISEKITECLVEAKHEYKEEFEQNLADYVQQLQQLDETLRDVVNNSKGDTLFFGDRFPFRYLVEEYDLEYYAAFPGCSSESEPSAATMIYLVDKIREQQVPIVFTLALSSDKIADALCEETGARKLVLHDCHNISGEDFGNGATYVSLMEENIENIKIALGN